MSLAELKQRVCAEVEAIQERLVELSHVIHANPELGFQEVETARRLTAALESRPGLAGERGVGEHPTAFKARLEGGAPGPTIAILAEYDALPRVGHACGHNIISTSAVGAGLALAAVADQLAGRIEVIGTPAEEGGGGKVYLLDRGVFDGVDAALIMHPSQDTHLCPRMLGMRSLPMEFRGTAAHGAQSPHEGRSALSGVIPKFNAIDAMRQHIRMDARIHGIITNGGEKPSVIPEFAACHFFVRAGDERYLDELEERVKSCARGAALVSGTEVTFLAPDFPAYRPFLPSKTISSYYRANVESLGERVKDLDEKFVYASNDIGNVSRRIPTVAMMFGISSGGMLADHSREFAEAAASPLGDRALIVSARSMAMTALDLLDDPGIVGAAKKELASSLSL
ncbi:MAG: M20 family metallopeptidase [Chloroflexi bacterium]|nr:M20 family metallopeptidase [Chloroflexota bacterium]